MEKHKLEVVVRVRPQLTPDNIWVRAVSDRCLQTINHRNIEESLEYEFERVFGPDTKQEAVYTSCVRPLLSRVLDGQNASVFAYGPTGSGKTHTILGAPNDPGIIPRCVEDLFANIRQQQAECGKTWSFAVTYSYLEIYNEKIQDLLEPRPIDFPIREDRSHNLFVCGLSEKSVSNIDEFNQSFLPASRNRTTAATRLNAHSSRSHSLLLIKVTKLQLATAVDARGSRRQLSGKLYIIDLAGSEDNRRTGNQGLRLKESGAINTSLFMLSEVVDALHKQKAVIPYRQSKLTRLLQDSLGGSACSCMIVNIAPEERHYLDTLSTLKLARKSKKIVNTVTVHEETLHEPVSRDINSNCRVKRVHSSIDQTDSRRPSDSEEIPFLSPLLRRQKQFENELKQNVRSRIAQLESQLLHNLQNSQFNSHTSPEPDSTTRSELDRTSATSNRFTVDQLSILREKLNDVKSTMSISSFDPVPLHHSTVLDADLDSLLDSPFVLPENVPPPKRRCVARSTTQRKGTRHTVTSSAESATTCDSIFGSTQKPSSESDCDRSGIQSVTLKMPYNPDFIQSHNCNVLKVLNTGSVKDIQKLYTIGAKKAQLIHNFRQFHGSFNEINDLLQVPNFTEAAVKKFCVANFIQL